jgi:hypothetical protein
MSHGIQQAQNFKGHRSSFVCASGLSFVGGNFFALANSRKISFGDSDLVFVRPTITTDSNAFWTLEKATNAFYWPEKQSKQLYDLGDDTNWNGSAATEVLAKNRVCLDFFDDAMRQPFFLVPELKTFDEDISYLAGWRKLALLESIQINSLHRTGKDEEAFDRVFEIIQFGQRVENSGGATIQFLVGSGIKAIGLTRVQMASRKCRDNVNVAATQILLALKVYKTQHGALPKSLSELVPEFFPSVPLDDFDGKPFRYLPDKKIIFSVGPCLKDLSGEEKKGESKDYNLPFKIEF